MFVDVFLLIDASVSVLCQWIMHWHLDTALLLTNGWCRQCFTAVIMLIMVWCCCCWWWRWWCRQCFTVITAVIILIMVWCCYCRWWWWWWWCRQFFTAVCDVDEPEVMFNIDQYSDVTCITKPIIYISIAEIVEIHKVRPCRFVPLMLMLSLL